MKTSLTLLAALALALAGCEDNRASIQIQAVCAPTDDCTFAATCDAQYIGWPTLDLNASTSDSVAIFLEVENQLPNNANLGTGRLNTNDAHVDEAIVEYVGLGEFIAGTNINIPAAGSAVLQVEVIPTGHATELVAFVGGEIVGNVRLGGYLDDGTRFETGDFPVTVRICAGCLTACGVPTCPPGRDGQLPITCITP